MMKLLAVFTVLMTLSLAACAAEKAKPTAVEPNKITLFDQPANVFDVSENGDVTVNGKVVATDKRVYQALGRIAAQTNQLRDAVQGCQSELAKLKK